MGLVGCFFQESGVQKTKSGVQIWIGSVVWVLGLEKILSFFGLMIKIFNSYFSCVTEFSSGIKKKVIFRVWACFYNKIFTCLINIYRCYVDSSQVIFIKKKSYVLSMWNCFTMELWWNFAVKCLIDEKIIFVYII